MFRESFDGNNLLLVMLFYKNLSFLLNKKSICNQCSQLFSFNCFFNKINKILFQQCDIGFKLD